MKKLLILVLILCLTALPALGETADAFTSASVADFYGAAGLTGDDLMNSINAYNGFFAIASVNPDGTPNIGFYIYSMVKYEDEYYLQLGLAPNQTTANMDNGSALMAMYAAVPAGEGAMPYATAGARMNLEKVTDEAVIAALKEIAPQQTEIRILRNTSDRPRPKTAGVFHNMWYNPSSAVSRATSRRLNTHTIWSRDRDPEDRRSSLWKRSP